MLQQMPTPMHTWAALTMTQWAIERKGRHEVRSELRALREGGNGYDPKYIVYISKIRE